MKKIFYALSCAAFIIFSCTKQQQHDHLEKTITIDTTLASGTLYSLGLKPYGDADDKAAITKQASVFTTSEIVNGSGFSPVYHFSATGDVKAPLEEQVVIAITEGGRNGNRHSRDSSLITINFKVQ